jgi:hypothetical protein
MDQLQQNLRPIFDLESNIVIEDNISVLELTKCDLFALDPEPFSVPTDTSFVDLETGTFDIDPYLVEPSIITTSSPSPHSSSSSSPSSPSNPKNLSNQQVQEIMTDIEHAVNFSSPREGLAALETPDILTSRIQNAFDTFKEKTGRNMTYSEMRHMMG